MAIYKDRCRGPVPTSVRGAGFYPVSGFGQTDWVISSSRAEYDSLERALSKPKQLMHPLLAWSLGDARIGNDIMTHVYGLARCPRSAAG